MIDMVVLKIEKLSSKKRKNYIPTIFVFTESGLIKESWTSEFTKKVEKIIEEEFGDKYECRIEIEEYNR